MVHTYWVAIGITLPLTLALLGADGTSYWLLLQPALLGAVLAASAFRTRHQRRILELEVELHEQRRITRAAIQERLALDDAKRRLITSISHELRTPLTSIKGYTEILEARRLGPLTERQARALQVVSRAVRREEALVENLLCFARLESGRYRVERESFDLRAVAAQVRESLAPFAQRRELRLVLALPEAPAVVSADRAGLEIVLAHLLENALKFTPAGGQVDLRVEAAGGDASVSVLDTGSGVPRDQRRRVFDPFFQADAGDTREHGGAGLGLPIVKGILEAHGVEVHVDERPGGGARFGFTLPLVRVAVGAS